MTIVIAVLLACILVAILVMISSVYQMNRDCRRKIGELCQKYLSLQHKLDHLEKEISTDEEAKDEPGV